jgi:hypothetical protein
MKIEHSSYFLEITKIKNLDILTFFYFLKSLISIFCKSLHKYEIQKINIFSYFYKIMILFINASHLLFD